MNALELFKKITTFIFDMDGVLTDGSLLLLENGLQARRMNIKDGFALQLAIKNGYKILIVSGGHSDPAAERLKRLGVTDIHMSIRDKIAVIEEYVKKNKLLQEQLLYMGDDLPDIPVLLSVGLPCCPADAASEVREISKYVSPFKGGEGCVRDVIEKVLRLNGHWQYRSDTSSR